MRVFGFIFLFLISAIILAGCAQSGPPTEGESRDFSHVCDKANNGKRVAVEGYLRFPNSFKGNDSVVLRLYNGSAFRGDPVGVQIGTGSTPNHVEMVKAQFTDADLKVHLADGEVSGFGNKVRVSGSVYFPVVSQEFPCSLENPLVEPVR